jgi:hypothetical protein
VSPNTQVEQTGYLRRPQQRGISGRSVIAEAKTKVPTIDFADLLAGPGKTHKRGAEWTTNCPLPDHQDKTPSFTVNPEKNLWFCHGCLRGGDVVKLASLAWGIDRADVAAAEVLLSFNHQIPSRPPSWFARQKRQQPVRDAIDAQKVEHIRDLVFQLIWIPWLRRLPDFVRYEASESAWEESRVIARMLYQQRGGTT